MPEDPLGDLGRAVFGVLRDPDSWKPGLMQTAVAAAEALSPEVLHQRALRREERRRRCLTCGREGGGHEPGCSADPDPAGASRHPSTPEENPVDENDYTPPNVTVSLRVTVPAEEVEAVVTHLAGQLSALLQGVGQTGGPLPFSSVSLDAYLTEQGSEQG